MAILKLTGNGGRTIYEIDTNLVRAYNLHDEDLIVRMVNGDVHVLDASQHKGLDDAMNTPR